MKIKGIVTDVQKGLSTISPGNLWAVMILEDRNLEKILQVPSLGPLWDPSKSLQRSFKHPSGSLQIFLWSLQEPEGSKQNPVRIHQVPARILLKPCQDPSGPCQVPAKILQVPAKIH